MNRLDRSRQRLAIGLAGLAGYVDAIGFLSADGYFVSFMSGNTTRLGVNLATDPARAIIPALLIGGFTCGVAAGALAAARAGARRKPAVLALVAILLLCGGLSGAAGFHGPLMAFLVLAMGALNNTFQRDGEVAVGLTYMTGALVKLGQALGGAMAGQKRTGWAAYMLLWGGLAAGAVGGAFAFAHIGPGALWLAFGGTALALGFALRLVD